MYKTLTYSTLFSIKVIVPTVVVQVSYYRKYTLTNIRIHFINNKLTSTFLLAMFSCEN